MYLEIFLYTRYLKNKKLNMVRVKKISEFGGHNGAVYSLAPSRTKNFFYSGGSDHLIAGWSFDDLPTERIRMQLPGIVYSLCLLEEKNVLLAGTSEGKIHGIHLLDNKEIVSLKNHANSVYDIRFDKVILTAGGDGVLSILSIEELKIIKTLKLCPEKLRALAVFKNTAAIACGDGLIRLLDLQDMKITHELNAHTGSVYSVAFSADGKYLLSGGKDARLNLWEALSGNWQKLKSVPAHNYAIYSIVLSPDGNYIATASRDKTIKLWSAKAFFGNESTPEVLARINKENFDGHTHSVNKLLWVKNSNTLISTGDDRKIMAWEIL
jgi:WD40 repeat protein